MKRDEQIGRMILEAATGIHGYVARDLAQAWVNIAEQKQELQSRLDSLEKDAARYRLLRSAQDTDKCKFAVVMNAHYDCYASSEDLDAALDEALQSQGATK